MHDYGAFDCACLSKTNFTIDIWEDNNLLLENVTGREHWLQLVRQQWADVVSGLSGSSAAFEEKKRWEGFGVVDAKKEGTLKTVIWNLLTFLSLNLLKHCFFFKF